MSPLDKGKPPHSQVGPLPWTDGLGYHSDHGMNASIKKQEKSNHLGGGRGNQGTGNIPLPKKTQTTHPLHKPLLFFFFLFPCAYK